MTSSGELRALVKEVSEKALQQFSSNNLQANELAITLGRFENGSYRQADYRGDELIYPASVVKLFFLVAAHGWLQDGSLTETEELRRAMQDMIVDSSNDATHYVIDVLTETTSGPELPAIEMAAWSAKRNAINEFFKKKGYANLNLNQKPWGDGPYGRERAFVGANFENRNKLTTNATARLLGDIVERKCITPERSHQMLALLKRDPGAESNDPHHQGSKFSGKGLPRSSRIWSKAGWTSTTRHDATYIEFEAGHRIILVVFTTNHADEHEIIPFIAQEVAKRL
jgi:beta-lactamase class A